MNYAGTDDALHVSKIGESVKQAVNQRSPIMSRGWVHNEPRRFVDHNYVVIPVNHAKVHFFGFEVRFFGRRHRHRVSFAEAGF